MPAGHLGRATIGRTLGFVGIGQSCENYRRIRIGRVWIGQNCPDLLTLSFQRLRVGVGFRLTRLSSLASQTPPLTDVILWVSGESHPVGVIANLVLRPRVPSLVRTRP